MKKTILTLLVVASIATQSKAQVSFGPEIGLNIAEYMFKAGNETATPQPKFSLRAGGIVDFGIGDHFSIQTGAYYVANGYNNSDGYGDAQHVNINTLEIPLNFVLKLRSPDVNRYWIGVGPYLAYNMGGTVKTTGAISSSSSLKIGSDSTSDFKSVDMGLSVTLGYQMPMGLFVRMHFNYGMVNLQPQGNSDNSIYTTSYGTTIGYLFGGHRGPKNYLRHYRY